MTGRPEDSTSGSGQPVLVQRAAPSSQAQLVARLQERQRLLSPRAADAMRRVDRRHFVSRDLLEAVFEHEDMDANAFRTLEYADRPLPIGPAQTISAPHMHALALDLLVDHLRPGARVLDVGSGSGYLSACLALLAGPQAHVIGVELSPALARTSVFSVERAVPGLMAGGGLRLLAGNMLDSEDPDLQGPFDAIHVGAAAASLPEVLLERLAPGGRMVIPVGAQHELQLLDCIDKDEQGRITTSHLTEVAFVPLIEP